MISINNFALFISIIISVIFFIITSSIFLSNKKIIIPKALIIIYILIESSILLMAYNNYSFIIKPSTYTIRHQYNISNVDKEERLIEYNNEKINIDLCSYADLAIIPQIESDNKVIEIVDKLIYDFGLFKVEFIGDPYYIVYIDYSDYNNLFNKVSLYEDKRGG